MSRATRDALVRALGVLACVFVLIGGWQSGGDGGSAWLVWIFLAVACVAVAWAISRGAPRGRP